MQVVFSVSSEDGAKCGIWRGSPTVSAAYQAHPVCGIRSVICRWLSEIWQTNRLESKWNRASVQQPGAHECWEVREPADTHLPLWARCLHTPTSKELGLNLIFSIPQTDGHLVRTLSVKNGREVAQSRWAGDVKSRLSSRPSSSVQRSWCVQFFSYKTLQLREERRAQPVWGLVNMDLGSWKWQQVERNGSNQQKRGRSSRTHPQSPGTRLRPCWWSPLIPAHVWETVTNIREMR